MVPHECNLQSDKEGERVGKGRYIYMKRRKIKGESLQI